MRRILFIPVLMLLVQEVSASKVVLYNQATHSVTLTIFSTSGEKESVTVTSQESTEVDFDWVQPDTRVAVQGGLGIALNRVGLYSLHNDAYLAIYAPQEADQTLSGWMTPQSTKKALGEITPSEIASTFSGTTQASVDAGIHGFGHHYLGSGTAQGSPNLNGSIEDINSNNDSQFISTAVCGTFVPSDYVVSLPGQKPPESGFDLVASTSKLWNQRTINIQFLDGTSNQQSIVRRAAAEWESCTGLRFEYSDARNPPRQRNITVSFGDQYAENSDCHSLIGTDSESGNPSMMLQGFDYIIDDAKKKVARTESDAMGTALHELGHALGFRHEHQNPAAGFRWNKKKVYSDFDRPPNKWSKSKVNRNVFEQLEETAAFSRFDPDSVMGYYIGRGWLLDKPEFSADAGDTLSAGDRAFAAQWYGQVLSRLPVEAGFAEDIAVTDIKFEKVDRTRFGDQYALSGDPKGLEGYTLIKTNLNHGTRGHGIFLNYQWGGDKRPITDLQVVTHENSQAAKRLIKPGYELIPQDLNEGAGGHYIYLCIKRGNGEPITDLKVIKGSSQKIQPPQGFTKVAPGDLNFKASGDYIYLCYKK